MSPQLRSADLSNLPPTNQIDDNPKSQERNSILPVKEDSVIGQLSCLDLMRRFVKCTTFDFNVFWQGYLCVDEQWDYLSRCTCILDNTHTVVDVDFSKIKPDIS